MKKLRAGQALRLHAMLIAQTGGSDGLRDSGMLDMALSGAFQTFGGDDIYPTTQHKAARLAFSIVKNHPFVDGNKRIGLFVMLVFLELNGIALTYTQPELVELGLGLADGTITAEAVLEWIQKRQVS